MFILILLINYKYDYKKFDLKIAGEIFTVNMI